VGRATLGRAGALHVRAWGRCGSGLSHEVGRAVKFSFFFSSELTNA